MASGTGRTVVCAAVALRLRRMGSDTLITLKRSTKMAVDSAGVRMEIEEPWSPAAIDSL